MILSYVSSKPSNTVTLKPEGKQNNTDHLFSTSYQMIIRRNSG